MPTIYTGTGRPVRTGAQTFRDVNGLRSIAKHRDDVITLTLDWSRELDSGETISTVTNTANGVTLSSASNTTTTTSVNVTGTGSLEVKVVTSSSRTIIETVNFYARNTGRVTKDY